MKLFKSLLVAPAALGLLAPMSATANEVTIGDFNSAEELAITNSRVDGLEARLNNIEAGSFSETTTASFSADMFLGAVTGGVRNDSTEPDELGDAVMAAYSFQIDLNTSFTGEDSLDISLDAGNTTANDLGIVESTEKSNLDLPFNSINSITVNNPVIFLPFLWINRATQSTVPPVARRSSTIAYELNFPNASL